jgi:hypothetical protein
MQLRMGELRVCSRLAGRRGEKKSLLVFSSANQPTRIAPKTDGR